MPGASSEGAEVTLRDYAWMAWLARVRWATVQEVAVAASMSPAMAYRRTRKLRGLGLIRAAARASVNDPVFLMLSKRGVDELRRYHGECDATAPRGAPRQRDHHRAIAATYAAFVAASAASSRFTLRDVRFAWELSGHENRIVVPDLLLAVERDDGERVAAVVEVDRGTVRANAMRRRFEIWGRALNRGQSVLGCPNQTLLVTVPTRRRLNRLFLACLDAAEPPPTFFALQTDVTAASALTSRVWATEHIDDEGVARLWASNPFLRGSHRGFTRC